jgi:Gpi18-like mannosyltransferase
MRDRTGAQPASSPPWAFIAVLIAILFVAYVRIRLADVPLERDEGEYAYAGQLILQGIPPYELAYNMKFPGTYYAYAVILALFGQTPWGIHIGLMIVNAATIVLVFAIGRRLFGELAGAVAAVSFAIFSIDVEVLGVFAHATHFVTLAAMAGLLLLLRAIESERIASYFWSGMLLGLSVLMKQHAIFYLPFAAAFVFWIERGKEAGDSRAWAKKIGAMGLGIALPPALIVIVLAAQGVLGRFWFWTFRYASEYVFESPLSKALPRLATSFMSISRNNVALWALAGIGLLLLWTTRWEPRARIVGTGLLTASFLVMCPGFWFREHYYIPTLAAAALLCGVAVVSLRRILETRLSPRAASALSVAVFGAAIAVYVTGERDYLFATTPRDLSRNIYSQNPFIEAVEIGKYIRDRTDGNDRIAVVGSEPEIYFYADRKSATGYIYTYALMEPQPFAKTMQAEMIREIESAHPRYLVFVWVQRSWLPREDSDQGIVSWGKAYVHACYDPVGVADIFSKAKTNMVWDDDVLRYQALTSDLVYTFRRKSDAPCTVSR